MWKEIKNLWSSDNLLNEAWDMAYEAISIDSEMFDEAVNALWTDDEKAVQKLIFKKDKLVNKYERDIRRKVVTHLAVKGGDIPAGLVLSTIIVDIERIGDYIKNIVELTDLHREELVAEADQKIELTNIENAIKKMFSKVADCVDEGDEDQALAIYTETNEIGKTCDEQIRLMIRKRDGNYAAETLAVLVLYFRYLKRINAHLRNIISSVINPYDRIGFKPKNK